jgi:hypothetical protein
MPAYITDKNGNSVYAEATITIFEGNIENSLRGLQDAYKDPEMTTEDYAVATFGHEGDHDTNQQAINAIKDRQEGRPNNFDVEAPAYEVTRQILRETQASRMPPPVPK